MIIKLGHSPDADDAFMFYPLTKGIIKSKNIEIQHYIEDIETLNKKAFEGYYDVSAISFYAYAKVKDTYDLMPCGASFGFDYGPIVVAKKEMTIEQLQNTIIAIPGENTTAFLLLKHYLGSFKYESVSFDSIIPAIINNKFGAGLIIHEGQLLYKKYGLFNVLDLASFWFNETKLPLPLGGLVVKKELSSEVKDETSYLIKKSIEYSLNNFREAFQYAKKFSREGTNEEIERFIKMYVNELTIDYGKEGRKALEEFYSKFKLPRIVISKDKRQKSKVKTQNHNSKLKTFIF